MAYPCAPRLNTWSGEMIVVKAVASSPRVSHTAIRTGPAGRTLVRDPEAESSEPKVPTIPSLAARLLTVLLMFFSATFQSSAGTFTGSPPQHHLPEYPGIGTKTAFARQSIWQTHAGDHAAGVVTATDVATGTSRTF